MHCLKAKLRLFFTTRTVDLAEYSWFSRALASPFRPRKRKDSGLACTIATADSRFLLVVKVRAVSGLDIELMAYLEEENGAAIPLGDPIFSVLRRAWKAVLLFLITTLRPGACRLLVVLIS